MANNFAGDPNLQALYRFEDEALTTDSSGKGNTLTAYHVAVADTVNFKEGACAADFELDNESGYYREDADLNADMPLKNGTTNKKFTICSWCKVESIANVTHKDIVTKCMTTSDEQSLRFSWWRYDDAAQLILTLVLGRAEAPGYQSITVFSFDPVGKWLHVAVTYDDSTRVWTGRLWDDGGDPPTAYSSNGVATNNIALYDVRLGIGTSHYGTAQLGEGIFDGLLDETVIFNRVLSEAEIDKIRQGTYSYRPHDLRLVKKAELPT